MTANELFGEHFNGLHYEDITIERIEAYAISFAKHHVEKALKSASEQATASNKSKFNGDVNPQVDIDSILEAYPLSNIK